jgi:DNA-binding NtrC family response regulator
VADLGVLLVDDEVEFLETLEKRLRRRNMDVRVATSGEQALEVMARFPPDVVVLDVKMPGMDGIDTLREIKRRAPLTEVVMLTGHANLEVAIQGMEMGAFDYLMKPVDIDELVYKLQDAHRRKTLQEERIRELEERDRLPGPGRGG